MSTIPRTVRAIFFDAVGTLIHPEPSAAAVYAAVAQRYGSARREEEIALRFAIAFAREDAWDREQGLRTSEAREVMRWRRIVAEVLDDVKDPESCFKELYEHFAVPGNWCCPPDTGEVLGALRNRGYSLGLASNYDRRLHPVVAGLRELRPIQHVVISSEVGWRKPAQEFYLALCRAAAFLPDQILLVGNEVVNDYEGACAAGCLALLLDPTGSTAKGRNSIKGLNELTF
jgi:putative hydrolase of the HAD superfamily